MAGVDAQGISSLSEMRYSRPRMKFKGSCQSMQGDWRWSEHDVQIGQVVECDAQGYRGHRWPDMKGHE